MHTVTQMRASALPRLGLSACLIFYTAEALLGGSASVTVRFGPAICEVTMGCKYSFFSIWKANEYDSADYMSPWRRVAISEQLWFTFYFYSQQEYEIRFQEEPTGAIAETHWFGIYALSGRLYYPERNSFKAILIPTWFIFATIITSKLPTGLRKFVCGKRRVSAGLCIICGYDLRASTGRCPECGAEPPGTTKDRKR